MNDLKDLLELALSDGHGPDPTRPVDPAGDLARGQHRVRRRRLVVGASSLAGCAIVAAALVPLAGRSGGGGAPVTSPVAGAAAPPHATALNTVALVAYQGRQPPGYRVAELPKGWVVQGGNAFALTIGPREARDKNPDVYVGKLVVKTSG